jgi:hypothetical protein
MFKKLPHLTQKVHRVENTFLLTYFWKTFFFFFFSKETRDPPPPPRKKVNTTHLQPLFTQ